MNSGIANKTNVFIALLVTYPRSLYLLSAPVEKCNGRLSKSVTPGTQQLRTLATVK